MIHRWMSARVKRGTNKRVRQIGQPSVPSVTNKENSCGCLSPPEKAQIREDRTLKMPEKGGEGVSRVWEGFSITLNYTDQSTVRKGLTKQKHH